jgi:hypothetical protein
MHVVSLTSNHTALYRVYPVSQNGDQFPRFAYDPGSAGMTYFFCPASIETLARWTSICFARRR